MQFLHCHIYVGLDVSRKKKSSHLQLARQHEQTGRAASHTQGKLPLQITHAQGDRTRGTSAPREEREGREMEGNSRGIVSFCCSYLPTKHQFVLLNKCVQNNSSCIHAPSDILDSVW